MIEFAVAFMATIALMFIVCVITLTAYHYAEGRKAGGYPIFARARRHVDFSQYAYNRGLRKGRDKIAKGGYK